MKALSCLILSAVLAAMLASPVQAQPAPGQVGSVIQGVTVVDGPIYVTTYVEVIPSATATALTALRDYRAAALREPGVMQIEIFQEEGQSYRFVVSEIWRNRAAAAGHGNAPSMTALAQKVKPIELGPLDARIHQAHAATPPKASTPNSVVIISHADVAGGNTQNLIRAFGPLNEASQRDNGMLRFEILDEVPAHVNHFRLFEEWANMAAFEAHNRAPHTQTYRQTILQWLGTPYDQRIYRLAN